MEELELEYKCWYERLSKNNKLFLEFVKYEYSEMDNFVEFDWGWRILKMEDWFEVEKIINLPND